VATPEPLALAGADAGGVADADTGGVADVDAARAGAAIRPAASRTAAADAAAGRGKRLAALPAAVRMAEKAAGNTPAVCSVNVSDPPARNHLM